MNATIQEIEGIDDYWGPAFRSVYEGEGHEAFVQQLDERIVQHDKEIEKLCNFHYQPKKRKRSHRPCKPIKSAGVSTEYQHSMSKIQCNPKASRRSYSSHGSNATSQPHYNLSDAVASSYDSNNKPKRQRLDPKRLGGYSNAFPNNTQRNNANHNSNNHGLDSSQSVNGELDDEICSFDRFTAGTLKPDKDHEGIGNWEVDSEELSCKEYDEITEYHTLANQQNRQGSGSENQADADSSDLRLLLRNRKQGRDASIEHHHIVLSKQNLDRSKESFKRRNVQSRGTPDETPHSYRGDASNRGTSKRNDGRYNASQGHKRRSRREEFEKHSDNRSTSASRHHGQRSYSSAERYHDYNRHVSNVQVEQCASNDRHYYESRTESPGKSRIVLVQDQSIYDTPNEFHYTPAAVENESDPNTSSDLRIYLKSKSKADDSINVTFPLSHHSRVSVNNHLSRNSSMEPNGVHVTRETTVYDSGSFEDHRHYDETRTAISKRHGQSHSLPGEGHCGESRRNLTELYHDQGHASRYHQSQTLSADLHHSESRALSDELYRKQSRPISDERHEDQSRDLSPKLHYDQKRFISDDPRHYYSDAFSAELYRLPTVLQRSQIRPPSTELCLRQRPSSTEHRSQSNVLTADPCYGQCRFTSAEFYRGQSSPTSAELHRGQSRPTSAENHRGQSHSTSAELHRGQSRPTSAELYRGQSHPTSAEVRYGQIRPTSAEHHRGQSRPTSAELHRGQSPTTFPEVHYGQSRPTSADHHRGQSRSTSAELHRGQSRPTSAEHHRGQSRSAELHRGQSRPTSAELTRGQSHPTSAEVRYGQIRPTSAEHHRSQSRPTSAELHRGQSPTTFPEVHYGQSRPTSAEHHRGQSRSTSAELHRGQSRPTSAEHHRGQSRSTSAELHRGQSRPTSAQLHRGQSRPSPAELLRGQSRPTSAELHRDQSRPTSAELHRGQKRTTSAEDRYGQSRPTSAELHRGQRRPTSAELYRGQSRPTSAKLQRNQSHSTSAELHCSVSHTFTDHLRGQNRATYAELLRGQSRPTSVELHSGQSHLTHGEIHHVQSSSRSAELQHSQRRPTSTELYGVQSRLTSVDLHRSQSRPTSTELHCGLIRPTSAGLDREHNRPTSAELYHSQSRPTSAEHHREKSGPMSAELVSDQSRPLSAEFHRDHNSPMSVEIQHNQSCDLPSEPDYNESSISCAEHLHDSRNNLSDEHHLEKHHCTSPKRNHSMFVETEPITISSSSKESSRDATPCVATDDTTNDDVRTEPNFSHASVERQCSPAPIIENISDDDQRSSLSTYLKCKLICRREVCAALSRSRSTSSESRGSSAEAQEVYKQVTTAEIQSVEINETARRQCSTPDPDVKVKPYDNVSNAVVEGKISYEHHSSKNADVPTGSRITPSGTVIIVKSEPNDTPIDVMASSDDSSDTVHLVSNVLVGHSPGHVEGLPKEIPLTVYSKRHPSQNSDVSLNNSLKPDTRDESTHDLLNTEASVKSKPLSLHVHQSSTEEHQANFKNIKSNHNICQPNSSNLPSSKEIHSKQKESQSGLDVYQIHPADRQPSPNRRQHIITVRNVEAINRSSIQSSLLNGNLLIATTTNRDPRLQNSNGTFEQITPLKPVQSALDSHSRSEPKSRTYNAVVANRDPRLRPRHDCGSLINVQNELNTITSQKSTQSTDTLPTVAKSLPDFNPSNKNQSIDTWINNVNEVSLKCNWTEQQVIKFAMSKLAGTAQRWHNGFTSNFSWDEWQKKLRSAFPADKNYGKMLSEMLNRTAKTGESLLDYYVEKVALLNRCGIKRKRAVDCIVFGIEDEKVRANAEIENFAEPDQLLQYFSNIEENNSS